MKAIKARIKNHITHDIHVTFHFVTLRDYIPFKALFAAFTVTSYMLTSNYPLNVSCRLTPMRDFTHFTFRIILGSSSVLLTAEAPG